MVKATFDMADGDRVPMVFESWPALVVWMENNRGRYTCMRAEDVKDDDKRADQ